MDTYRMNRTDWHTGALAWIRSIHSCITGRYQWYYAGNMPVALRERRVAEEIRMMDESRPEYV